MKERLRGAILDTRWFDLQQGCVYTGLGRNTFREWAKQNGAEIKIGRIVRYDKGVIDAAMDKAVKASGN